MPIFVMYLLVLYTWTCHWYIKESQDCMRIPFSWLLGWRFYLCLHDDIVLLFYIYFCTSSFRPIILLGHNVFLNFHFQSWFHYWQDQFLRNPNYWTSLHLVVHSCLTWYFLLLIRTFCRVFCHVTSCLSTIHF